MGFPPICHYVANARGRVGCSSVTGSGMCRQVICPIGRSMNAVSRHPGSSVAGTSWKKPWATSDRIQRGFSRHLSMTPKKEIPQQKRKPISKHTCKTGGLVRFVWCFAQSAWERVTWFSQLLDSDSARKRWSNETRKSNSS